MLLQRPTHRACSTSSSSRQHAVPLTAVSHSSRAAQHPAATTARHRHGAACPAAVISSSAGSVSSCNWRSSSIRSGSIICRDRPMWARGPAPEDDGGALARMITRQIAGCDSIIALSDVYDEWGGSFNYIHAAAAVVKASKLRPRETDSPLVAKLLQTWVSQLADSTQREAANVLWAFASLRKVPKLQSVWALTLEKFVAQTQQQAASQGGSVSQNIANVVWACAKLRKQPATGELQLLVQTFLQPGVLAAARSQDVANMAWALSKLCQLPGWQGGVSEQDVQQLLGQEQLQLVAASEYTQHPCNVLVALAFMSAGVVPLVNRAYAHDCGAKLLVLARKRPADGRPQDVTNTLWACSELGLVDSQFLKAAVRTAARWCPLSTVANISQAATACAQMHYADEVFFRLLLQQGVQLVQQQHGRQDGRSRSLSAQDKASLASLCSVSVAKLDMLNLAAAARQLVVASGVGGMSDIVPANLRQLYVFHTWLLQLDGKGLSGVLTEQQLLQGEQDVAVYGDDIKSASVV